MVYSETKKLETGKNTVHDITAEVNAVLAASGVKNGILVVETKHSTAGIVRTTAWGHEVLDDLVKEMRRIVPARINFKHEESPEDAAGHLKNAFFGSSVSCIVRDGRLVADGGLGVYFMEYDGPRSRIYDVCVVGE